MKSQDGQEQLTLALFVHVLGDIADNIPFTTR